MNLYKKNAKFDNALRTLDRRVKSGLSNRGISSKTARNASNEAYDIAQKAAISANQKAGSVKYTAQDFLHETTVDNSTFYTLTRSQSVWSNVDSSVMDRATESISRLGSITDENTAAFLALNNQELQQFGSVSAVVDENNNVVEINHLTKNQKAVLAQSEDRRQKEASAAFRQDLANSDFFDAKYNSQELFDRLGDMFDEGKYKGAAKVMYLSEMLDDFNSKLAAARAKLDDIKREMVGATGDDYAELKAMFDAQSSIVDQYEADVYTLDKMVDRAKNWVKGW